MMKTADDVRGERLEYVATKKKYDPKYVQNICEASSVPSYTPSRVKSEHGSTRADPVMNLSLVTSLAVNYDMLNHTSRPNPKICLNHLRPPSPLWLVSAAERCLCCAGGWCVCDPHPPRSLNPPAPHPHILAQPITPSRPSLICDYVSSRRPFIPD